MDRRRRTLVKTLTFRILATIVTMTLVYAFTGSLEIAGAIGALEIVSKLILYYFHERLWERITWGKRRRK